jgi:hypothetical protein
MESTENDRTVFRPSHKTLKIEKTDFHIPTATTTTEQSFHLKTRKPVQTTGAISEHLTLPYGFHENPPIRADFFNTLRPNHPSNLHCALNLG